MGSDGTRHAQPLVSVVTPSFNQARFLEDTIQSVLSQDYPRIEHLVIDGGSTDGTRELLQRYADRLAYWISEPDEGQSHAVNKGFAQAQGEIVAWLNSDDVYFSRSTIAEVVEAFRRYPDADIIYGDTGLINQDGLVYRLVPSMKRVSLRRLAFSCLSQGATFFRRRVVKSFPLCQDLHYRMDYEYWLRLCSAGIRFQYVPRLWLAFRVHGASKTSETGCGLDQELLAIKREYFNGAWKARRPLEPVLRRSLGVWLRLRGAMRAAELYQASLAFHGQRLPRAAFYRHQLFSTTFRFSA